MKKTSIRTAILIPSLAVLIAGIIAMVAVVGVLSSNTTNDLTDQLIEARVNEYTNEFRALCQDVYGVVTATAPIISNYIDPEFAEDVTSPRTEVINILNRVLLSNSKITAAWTCWEPNAFDGKDSEFAGTSFYDSTGRFAPYVYQDGNAAEVDILIGYDSETEGEYYQGALNSGKPYMTNPYYYDFDGTEMLLCTIAIPILQDGKVVGVVGADMNLSEFASLMNSASILSDGYLFTLSPGGIISTHSNQDILMTRYDTTWMKDYSTQVENVLANGGSFNVTTYSDITNSNILFLGTGVTIGETGSYWIVCGIVPEKTVNATSSSLVWTIIAIGAALILLVGLTIFVIIRNSLKDLPVLTATAEAIALGDINAVNLNSGAEATKNEISLLARAFSKMTDGIRQQAGALASVANGDYTVTIPIRSEQDMMNKAINSMLVSNNGIMGDIRTAASQVASGAMQIAQASQNLATGSSQQSATIEEFTSTLTEVETMAKENAKISTVAQTQMQEVGKLVGDCIGDMNNMLEAMRDINSSSQNISKVIKVIDDIAFQTNILALNAAVEAARAGQHGKGFAVVADEVRNLASKSAEAAKETSGMIEKSIKSVNEGNVIVEKVSGSIQNVCEIAEQSAESVGKIYSASLQQSNSMEEVTSGITQLSSVVEANAATAQQTAASSEEMSAQSATLDKIVSGFKLKDALDAATMKDF